MHQCQIPALTVAPPDATLRRATRGICGVIAAVIFDGPRVRPHTRRGGPQRFRPVREERTMKRLAVPFLVILALVLTACGSSSSSPTATSAPAATKAPAATTAAGSAAAPSVSATAPAASAATGSGSPAALSGQPI